MLGEILRLLRVQSDLTQQNVADALDIQRSTYAYYETGRSKPSVETLTRLAKMYKISMDYFFDNSDTTMTVLHSPKADYHANRKEPECISELDNDEKKLVLMYRQLEKKEDVLAFIKKNYQESLLKSKNHY